MSETIPSEAALLLEFQDVAKQLDEVLKDLEWRKPDVESEEAKLKQLLEASKKDPLVDVATQAVVVRVGREILNDKIVEAERLEKRMMEIQALLEKAQGPETAPVESEKPGEAVRQAPE